MTNSKALEALNKQYQCNGQIASVDEIIVIEGEDAVIEVKAIDLQIAIAALTELEEIKKRAEEYAIRLEEEKGKPYSMLLLGEDKVIDLINYILKGETK